MIMGCLSAMGMLLFSASEPAVVPVVQNGGFEQVDGSNVPAGWSFSCSNGCQGAMEINREIKSEGAQSVRLSSETEESPHVYCGLFQTVGSLIPGKTYRFSLKAKSEDAGACWFGGGPDWATRFFFADETFDWQEFAVEWTCPADYNSFEFRINVDSPTGALWIDDVRVAVVTPEPQAAADPATVEKALDLIAQQEKRIPELDARLATAVQDGIPVPYPRADLAIAQMFCGFCRDDVAQDRLARALKVASEVKVLLDRAEIEMRKGVDVPVLKKDSPIEIRDGSFWAACTLGGQERMQPVFLTGYGHFPRVVEDLPLLSRMGINVIQTEIGPESIVFEDGARTGEIKSRILPALDRARDNGARMCLLISPHYFPGWAYKKWPDLAIDKPGFLKNTLDAPQVRDIYKKQLDTLIPLIKDHPALHSICLSNEPVSLNAQNDPFRLPLWHAYIERKHKSIDALNAIYGTQYASFAEVPHPRMAFDEKPAALYDGVRFNQECFAEWHAWMAETIHVMAPNLPCHAKVMLLPADRGTVLWGTDPWDFARLSQINGNDCSFLQAPAGSSWASGWSGQNMYYDLERSMKRVPIFNTENHIIRDREQEHIEGSHIYAAIWQGAIHGQGASTTWVWERTNDRKSDFEGSILHRPCCAAAMSRCALDLMRCANEVAALQNIEPRVAVLYSNAAATWNPGYVAARSRVYEALNFCGIPIGFITDEQIAAGELSRYACLVVPGAPHAARNAIEGIRKYAEGGGLVIAYGPSNLE
ncbi:MAG: hypothetical protein QG656_2266, partial [Candidatus Hydrogenedentes bacterium]|nr:hypothetical protein [Candidatus Hydrogenedentota bacterium]